MKSNILHSTARIIVLLFCTSLLIPFQNCAVYKSDGREEFASSLAVASDKGCYPYIDTNIAMQFLGITDDSLEVYKNREVGEDAYFCDFHSKGYLLKHINCKVSQGNGEQALLLILNGMTAFEDTTGIWKAAAIGLRTGFQGENHSGYVTLDADGLSTIRYLALDGSEVKGAACSVRLNNSDYMSNLAFVQNTLSKMATEMAINNNE